MKFEIFYPNYSRKAISFTLDDGRIDSDGAVLSIFRPHGIKGTFNISHTETLSPEDYRIFYRGYEISNHVKYHPYAFSDGVQYDVTDEALNPEDADESKVYKHPQYDGVYCIHRPAGWRNIATPARYIELTEIAKREIEAVFGEGSVKGFVWPFGEQSSEEIKKYLSDTGYASVRKTGATEDSGGFRVPSDRMAWSYNATHRELLRVAEKFENYPDDGELKCFIFGVHSIDFDRYDGYASLREFCEKYGSRPADFWYATVGEIFDYKDAADKIREECGTLYNPSDISVYVGIDGEKYEIPPMGTLRV